MNSTGSREPSFHYEGFLKECGTKRSVFFYFPCQHLGSVYLSVDGAIIVVWACSVWACMIWRLSVYCLARAALACRQYTVCRPGIYA